MLSIKKVARKFASQSDADALTPRRDRGPGKSNHWLKWGGSVRQAVET